MLISLKKLSLLQTLLNNMKWVTFFSQTGSEIVEICKSLKRWPDKICTNKTLSELDTINSSLLDQCFDRILFIPNKPKVEEYKTCLKTITKEDVVTLHGYLRIIPSTICSTYKIYNGHPGDIIAYPELAGFNPQEKAYHLGIKNTGSVIHEVTPQVDGGPVIARRQCNINLKSLDKTYKILHNNSIALWVEFLRKLFKIKA